ncbi:MAG: 30S ribosomal protein S3 [Rickettsiales bacterium]|jgi:small subunit ribosomal protein S3|nr:30S ribosomal protein S3 [Rickettsiales bacterium]
MGQKVNPVGYRLLTNHNWNSVWYKNKGEYADNLLRDLRIRDYVLKNFGESAISKVIIERVGGTTTVIIKTAKPGVLIGKKGSDLDKIKDKVREFGEKEINLKVNEVTQPDTDAQVVANSIARQIENRAAYKRVIKRAIQTSMRYGIQGIKIKVGGRLNGADIARSETFKEGSIPLHTLKADVDYATAEANTIMGIIGVKVWICKSSKGQKKTFNDRRNDRNDRNDRGGRGDRNERRGDRNKGKE